MCGIFGIVLNERHLFRPDEVLIDLQLLSELSMTRGRDARRAGNMQWGVIACNSKSLQSLDLVNCEDYKKLLNGAYEEITDENASQGLIAIGHSRLVTNGSLALESNNQPIADGVVVGVHNGIVVNTNRLQECDEQFESKKTPLSESQPSAEGVFSTSDSRELIKTISSMRKKLGCLANATKSVFKLIEGSASVALIDNAEASLILATNTGSVYFVSPKTNGVLVFASEKIFLERFLQKSKIFHNVEWHQFSKSKLVA